MLHADHFTVDARVCVVLRRLQLPNQIRDLVEGSVVTRGRPADCNWMRVLLQEGSALQIGLASSAVTTGSTQSKAPATFAKFTPEGVAERTHAA